MQKVVQKFRDTFKNASLGDDVWQTFKTEETLLELDTKLDNFVGIRIEVSNYWQVVKGKYDSSDLPEASEVEKIIEKFKRKHPKIILV